MRKGRSSRHPGERLLFSIREKRRGAERKRKRQNRARYGLTREIGTRTSTMARRKKTLGIVFVANGSNRNARGVVPGGTSKRGP